MEDATGSVCALAGAISLSGRVTNVKFATEP